METTKNFINVLQRNTFLVKFKYQSSEQYIVQGLGLVDILKNCDKNGIEFIKIFNPAKHRFVRVSRQEILDNFSCETAAFEYLSKHYFFN